VTIWLKLERRLLQIGLKWSKVWSRCTSHNLQPKPNKWLHWLDHIIWSSVNNGAILHLIRNILNFRFNNNHTINTCWYRNPKHIRLELNIPQWLALMSHLSLSSFSSWSPYWVTNTSYFQKLKLFDSKVGSNFLDCQFHGLVGSRLYHACQFGVQNEASFRPLGETIPWSGYCVQFRVLNFFLK
jgi:hypothetical protein